MATQWGLHCKTCMINGPQNFRENQLPAVVRVYPHLLAIQECQTYIHIEISNDYDEPNLMTFLYEHSAHDLAMVDEYGVVKDFPLEAFEPETERVPVIVEGKPLSETIIEDREPFSIADIQSTEISRYCPECGRHSVLPAGSACGVEYGDLGRPCPGVIRET